MKNFLALCWRDLWRNRRRTVLTGLVMVFSVAVMILFVGMGDGMHTQMIRGATDSFLGHLQVQHPGYHDEPDLEHQISGADLNALVPLLEDMPGVLGFAPRLQTGGLLSKKVPDPPDEDNLSSWKGMTSEGAFVVGIRPDAERKVSTLESSLVADEPLQRCLRGCRAARAEIYAEDRDCDSLCPTLSALDGKCDEAGATVCKGRCPAGDDLCDEADCTDRFRDYCPPSRFLASTDPHADNPYMGEIVLGTGLAMLLDVGVGDRVALTTGTARGRAFASLYKVVGLIKTGSLDINRTFALTHLDKLSAGLETNGGASAMVVAVDDLEGASEVAEELGRRLEAAGIGLSALSWRQLSPELDVYVKLDQGSLLVTLALLIMIVGVILANVVTMSVMERTREFGVRMAVGESPGRIAVGLVVEMVILALLSGAVGTGIGEAFNWYYSVNGYDLGMGEVSITGVVLSTVYYTELTLYGVVFSVGTVVAYAVLGSLYPALRIHRLRPVDAIRFV
jgi:ABC-type lipoprotein release transport system permease subunit